MRKILSLITVLMLCFYAAPAYSQAPVPSPGVSQFPQGMIGVIAAVKGDVEVMSSQAVGRIVDSGAPIFLGDEIKTDGQGHLQILLMDQTVFTIGQNSSLVIDEFVYDPATHDGKIDVRILQGAFRYISGKIPTTKPDNVDIRLPSGSVGIRGTILYGQVDGNRSKLLLLGPGENNNTQHTRGKIMVNNDVNGRMVTAVIKKSGYGSEIKGENVPPTPAYAFSPAEVQEMIQPFSVEQKKSSDKGEAPAATGKREGAKKENSDDRKNGNLGDKNDFNRSKSGVVRQKMDRNSHDSGTVDKNDDDPMINQDPNKVTGDDTMTRDDGGEFSLSNDRFAFEGSATDAAGQTEAGTFNTIDDSFTRSDFFFKRETDDIAQNLLKDLKALDGVTRIEDLITYQAGSATYSVYGVSMNKGGSFDANIEIDFDAKEIGGGSSSVSYSALSSGVGVDGSKSLGTHNYSSSSGDASFTVPLGNNTICGSGCVGSFNITLNTQNEVPGDNAQITLNVNNGTAQTGSANVKAVFD